MSGGKQLSKAEMLALGESRESWCAVEMKKEQDWCRKQRQHYPQQFSSTVFEQQVPGYEPRCTFEVDAPTHRERRHYKDQCYL
ncbi:protein SPATA45 homolog isoform X2 [Crassostrea virginica]